MENNANSIVQASASTSAPDSAMIYLSPLTLDAEFFLRSLVNHSNSQVYLDDNLYLRLEAIMNAIENLLVKNGGKENSHILATEKTKLIKAKEIKNIQRVFHCAKCAVDLGKSVEKCAMHLHNQHESIVKPKKKLKAEKRDEKCRSLSKKARTLLKGDLLKFFAENLPLADALKQIPQYDEIEEQILTLIKPQFPNETIKFYKFGSRISGVGTRNSDLDIFIDIGGTFHNFEERASSRTLQVLHHVRSALLKDPKVWRQLISIDSARVPIIRVMNASSNIKCDIGFSNSLGYCNTILVQYLFELQPMLRCMFVFMKKWLERTKFDIHLTSYALLLMTIFYLQTQLQLPSIECLQKTLQNRVNVGPWISNVSSKTLKELNIPKIELNAKNYKNYIKDFFHYYVNFDFATYIVCPYLGRPIERKRFNSEMPEHYKKYVAESNEFALDCNKVIIVQDPIQLNHNVLKSLSEVVCKHLMFYLQKSEETLNE